VLSEDPVSVHSVAAWYEERGLDWGSEIMAHVGQ